MTFDKERACVHKSVYDGVGLDLKDFLSGRFGSVDYNPDLLKRDFEICKEYYRAYVKMRRTVNDAGGPMVFIPSVSGEKIFDRIEFKEIKYFAEYLTEEYGI